MRWFSITILPYCRYSGNAVVQHCMKLNHRATNSKLWSTVLWQCTFSSYATGRCIWSGWTCLSPADIRWTNRSNKSADPAPHPWAHPGGTSTSEHSFIVAASHLLDKRLLFEDLQRNAVFDSDSYTVCRSWSAHIWVVLIELNRLKSRSTCIEGGIAGKWRLAKPPYPHMHRDFRGCWTWPASHSFGPWPQTALLWRAAAEWQACSCVTVCDEPDASFFPRAGWSLENTETIW